MPDEIPLRAHCKAGRLAALKDLKLNQGQIAGCLEEQMNWKPQPLLRKDSPSARLWATWRDPSLPPAGAQPPGVAHTQPDAPKNSGGVLPIPECFPPSI